MTWQYIINVLIVFVISGVILLRKIYFRDNTSDVNKLVTLSCSFAQEKIQYKLLNIVLKYNNGTLDVVEIFNCNKIC